MTTSTFKHNKVDDLTSYFMHSPFTINFGCQTFLMTFCLMHFPKLLSLALLYFQTSGLTSGTVTDYIKSVCNLTPLGINFMWVCFFFAKLMLK